MLVGTGELVCLFGHMFEGDCGGGNDGAGGGAGGGGGFVVQVVFRELVWLGGV